LSVTAPGPRIPGGRRERALLWTFFSELVAVGGSVYFTAGNTLWKSDGTAEGTVLVKDLRPGAQTSAPANLTQVEGVL